MDLLLLDHAEERWVLNKVTVLVQLYPPRHLGRHLQSRLEQPVAQLVKDAHTLGPKAEACAGCLDDVILALEHDEVGYAGLLEGVCEDEAARAGTGDDGSHFLLGLVTWVNRISISCRGLI